MASRAGNHLSGSMGRHRKYFCNIVLDFCNYFYILSKALADGHQAAPTKKAWKVGCCPFCYSYSASRSRRKEAARCRVGQKVSGGFINFMDQNLMEDPDIKAIACNAELSPFCCQRADGM